MGTGTHQVWVFTLTLFEPGGADYAHSIMMSPPSFESHRHTDIDLTDKLCFDMGVGYLSKILGLKLFKYLFFLAETTTEEALISFGSKIPSETPSETPTVTVTPETLPKLTTIPFADEIVTKSTTVTPSPQGDLENELFDPTQAPEDLEGDLFDTTMMPDLSKSTTEPATIVPAGKFCNQKNVINF